MEANYKRLKGTPIMIKVQAHDYVKKEQEKLIEWIMVAKIEKCLYKRIATSGQ